MSLRKQATSGLVWTFTQQFGNQILSFIISLILARLLMPEEFGLIGMIAIFISIGKVLVNSGMTQSLVRSEEVGQNDYSTVFFFNLAASAVIYLTIFFAAPFIADFYSQSILTDIVRLYTLTFIIDAFGTIQATRLTKSMDFKTQMLIALPSTFVGGIVGITMAYTGFGVWSLVWSNIVKSIVHSVQFWFYTEWKPSLVFSKKLFKSHFKFGYNLTIAGILGKIFDNLYLIVIGKFYSASQVGFYTRAATMKQLPVTNISGALSKVTYPLFASIQNDDVRLKRVYQQIMQSVIFIIAPTLVFLGVLAEPLFRFLFTEKWLPAVPYFQILIVPGILYPIHSYNLNILKVKGRSDLFLRLDIIKKILISIVVIIALQFGIFALLYGQIVTSIVSFFINTYYSGKFIDYTTLDQAKDIIPSLILTVTVGAIIFILDVNILSEYSDLVRILGGSAIGGILYLLLAMVFKMDGFMELKKLILKK